jgi:hypothetical protein
MPIRIEVLDDGEIEIFDSKHRRWSKYEDVPKALAAIARILYRLINEQRREQVMPFRVQ